MMQKASRKKLKKIAIWYLGPVAVVLAVLFLAFAAAGAGIAGYMAYQTTQTIRAEHELISESLTGNCKVALERQGFTVEKKVEEPEEEGEEGEQESE